MNSRSIWSILRFELQIQTHTKSFWLVAVIPPVAMIVMWLVNMNSMHIDNLLVDNQTELRQPISPSGSMQVSYSQDNDWRAHGYDAYAVIKKGKDSSVVCQLSTVNMLSPSNLMKIEDDLRTKCAEASLGVDLQRAKKGVKLAVEVNSDHQPNELLSISLIAVLLIYIIILQFASSILRIAGREKAGKISEILLSSMSSADIMLGKLTACLLVAFIQIAIWLGVGLIFVALVQYTSLFNDLGLQADITALFPTTSVGRLVLFFGLYLVFLVGGFLLYSILFFILGAISNENTSTQQYSLIVTMPLLLTFMYVVQDFGMLSDGSYALLYIPFSSPIAAVPVLAQEGFTWQIALSLFVLFASVFVVFYFSTILYDTL